MSVIHGTQSGASVSLQRHRIDFINQRGLEGAKEIIGAIKKRRAVTVLSLPHNELEAEGCKALFDFLTTGEGKKHPIEEMILTANKLGNIGLKYVVEYLRNNVHLKKLLLQNNGFEVDTALFEDLADAVNSSVLETLYIGTNNGLSDAFAHAFLPRLNAPCLRELNMSSSRLSAQSLPDITDYLCSPDRCRLNTFGCSGNSLGTAGVRQIIEDLKKANYRLQKLDIFANATADENVDSEENRDEWRQTYNELTKFLSRNGLLTRETKSQALQLLHYSRPALLHHAVSLPDQTCEDCSCKPHLQRMSSTTSSVSAERATPTSSSLILPVEIKQYILSFFAPVLSPSQRIRIFHYAASPNTLPPLIPCLYKAHEPTSRNQQSPCLPDPTSFALGDAKGSCPPGQCMGSHNSLTCHRADDRVRWLEIVGCDAYDPPIVTPPAVDSVPSESEQT